MNIVKDLIVLKMLQFETQYFNRTLDFAFALLATTYEILQVDVSAYSVAVMLGFSSPVASYEFETDHPIDSYWLGSCDVLNNEEIMELIKVIRPSIKYNAHAYG